MRSFTADSRVMLVVCVFEELLLFLPVAELVTSVCEVLTVNVSVGIAELIWEAFFESTFLHIILHAFIHAVSSAP